MHELLYFDLLLLKILFEHSESTDPSFFDELIITCKLPGDLLGVISRCEIIIHIHGTVSDILFLHHMFSIELDGKVGRVKIEFIDVFDVDYID